MTRFRFLWFFHPLFHRRGDRDACWVCRMTWRKVMQDTALVAELERGLADIEAGRATRWADIRREQ